MISSSCHKSPPHNTTLLEVLRVRGFLFFSMESKLLISLRISQFSRSCKIGVGKGQRSSRFWTPHRCRTLEFPASTLAPTALFIVSSCMENQGLQTHGAMCVHSIQTYYLGSTTNVSFSPFKLVRETRKAEKLLEPCLNYLQFFSTVALHNPPHSRIAHPTFFLKRHYHIGFCLFLDLSVGLL